MKTITDYAPMIWSRAERARHAAEVRREVLMAYTWLCAVALVLMLVSFGAGVLWGIVELALEF